MVTRRLAVAWPVALLAAALAAPAMPGDDGAEPDQVTVQHVLVGFKRKIPGKTLDRTKKEARELAEAILQRAREGEEFDALVEQYTDDRSPGIMVIKNGTAPIGSDVTSRDGVVPGFGDLAFELEVGEVGLVDYHAAMSPYGYHVMKRLE